MRPMQDIIDIKAKKIKLLICDVDGVLTDGGLYFDREGNESKRFHSQDGLGLKLLMDNGIQVAIVSARSAPSVAQRMKNLGIKHYYQGQENKKIALLELAQTLDLDLSEIAYIGDDLIDLPILTRVGLAVGVVNSVKDILPFVDYTTKKSGGQGAVREVCDKILKAQNLYDKILQDFLDT